MNNYTARKLKELRLAKGYAGYSLQAVAEDLGIGKSTLSDIENGKQRASVEQLQMFADYYGVAITELLPPPPRAK